MTIIVTCSCNTDTIYYKYSKIFYLYRYDSYHVDTFALNFLYFDTSNRAKHL